MPRRTLWIILAVVVLSVACYERADRSPYGRWFADILERVNREYVEPVDEQKLFEGALEGMMGRLDDYSAYLPRSLTPQFQEALDQHYGGVGIEVSLEGPDKQLTVMSPLVGGPAYKAGVRSGDQIIAVDGQSIAKLQLNQIVRKLRGKPGEAVTISVLRPGEEKPLAFTLVRAVIKIDSVLGDVRQADGSWNFFLPGEDRIGYVRINSFGESTLTEFSAAMDWLTQRDCRGLILDMRNNPGGLLQAAVGLSDMFLPGGLEIVSTRGRDARERRREVSTGTGRYSSLPLVVIVNDKSASAAEIVAACLQDHHRATIVGERTWGKGTVQNVIPVEGGNSLLKLTIASYWRPSGKNIHRSSLSQETDEWGVKPDAEGASKLDEKQTAQFLEKRRQRDLLPRPGAEASPDATSPVEFDTQLKRAVELMQLKLQKMGKSQA